MKPAVYRYTFDRKTPLLDAEMSLHLAMIAIEGLLGQASVHMDASYHVDEPRNVIIVDGTTLVGAAMVRVFTAFLIREFGDSAFTVRRVEAAISTAPAKEVV